MVTGTGSETRFGNFDAIWFRENVLSGTNWILKGIWFRENVLDGTKWGCNGAPFRENVLSETKSKRLHSDGAQLSSNKN